MYSLKKLFLQYTDVRDVKKALVNTILPNALFDNFDIATPTKNTYGTQICKLGTRKKSAFIYI